MKKYTLRILSFTFLAAISVLWICCNGRKNAEKLVQKESFDFADSLWIDFSSAIKNRDYDYLIEHSFETIECVDCVSDLSIKGSLYRSDLIFKHHLDRLYNYEILKNLDFSTVYADSNVIRVSYSVKSDEAPANGNNIVYTFIKSDDKYLFQGMITVP